MTQQCVLEQVLSAEPGRGPGVDYGEVFTRRWVVELILDLVGYTPDRDLSAITLVEPSCGTGSFLVVAAERLIESCRAFDRDINSATKAIRAFDVLSANANRTRKALVDVLTNHGDASQPTAEALTKAWVSTGDFLLENLGELRADVVVGNPPYIRLEHIPEETRAAYRRACKTMRGRADVYVGFIERSLHLLRPGGALAFICADRWMRNQYGAGLRGLIADRFAVESVISMHDVDAFEDEVSAYPAIVTFRNQPQQKMAIVDTNSRFGPADAHHLSTWIRKGQTASVRRPTYEASRVDKRINGPDPWPSASPAKLAVLADIESRFPPLESASSQTRVGVGVATGCDDVFITTNPDLVESERLLPLLRAPDISTGSIRWSGRYLVNPWNGRGLVDLTAYPRLAEHLGNNRHRLSGRHIARRRPHAWYRTIDRVDQRLVEQPKLLLPDIKGSAHPVLDPGGHYPNHNLYFVVSHDWDLDVLGGILMSDIANLFVGAYCVRMRGGAFRFQAQYIRRIRVPEMSHIKKSDARALAAAFDERDRERATGTAAKVYGVDVDLLCRNAVITEGES